MNGDAPLNAARPASARIAAFAGYLREYGYTLGVAETADLLQSAEWLSAAPPRLVRHAWRSLVCRHPSEWAQWDDLYARFWHPERVKGTVKVTGRTVARRDLRAAVANLQESLGGVSSAPTPDAAARPSSGFLDTPDASPAASDSLGAAMGGASRVDPLHDRSQTMWWPDDLTQLQLLARQIARAFRPLRTRRFVPHPHADRLDVRGTLRRSTADGGALLQPVWRTHRRVTPSLWLFVDVSRSMEAHAALYLRVARAFVREADARVFVFHTQITEVTALLRRDSGRIQEKINAVTAGFGGGTRIADCLNTFAHGEGRSALRRGARLWILSDGYDTGEPSDLTAALQGLRRAGSQVVWFHPTRTTALSTALSGARRLIDVMLPLASLQDLQAAAPRLR
jgi:uncharacterized protein